MTWCGFGFVRDGGRGSGESTLYMRRRACWPVGKRDLVVSRGRPELLVRQHLLVVVKQALRIVRGRGLPSVRPPAARVASMK